MTLWDLSRIRESEGEKLYPQRKQGCRQDLDLHNLNLVIHDLCVVGPTEKRYGDQKAFSSTQRDQMKKRRQFCRYCQGLWKFHEKPF